MQRIDVLVVGLGPAGAEAARAAAAAGARVIAVDRRRVPGEPVQCAEFLPLAAGSVPSDTVVQRIRAMRTYLPSGAVQDSTSPGVILDRARFDAALANSTGSAGADIRTGTTLVSLDSEEGEASLRRGGRVERVGFRMLVAADGPRSTVARALSLDDLPCIFARQYRVELRRPSDVLSCWLQPEYGSGYGWLFPRGGGANLGLAASDRRLIKPLLDELHRRLVNSGEVGEGIDASTGGPIPVGGLRKTLVAGNVLFAGDAAGLAHPVSGAGIAPALVSGRAAGGAAVGALDGACSALDEYAEELRDRFGASYVHAVRRRRKTRTGDSEARRTWVSFREYHAA